MFVSFLPGTGGFSAPGQLITLTMTTVYTTTQRIFTLVTTLTTVTQARRVTVTTYTLGRTSRIYATSLTTYTTEISYRTGVFVTYATSDVTCANAIVTTVLETGTLGGGLSAVYVSTVGVLVGLVFLGGYFLGNRRRRATQLAISSVPTEAKRYAELLSKLENLRINQRLPERIHSKLEEEYVLRLRAALEATE
jgi:hypothetical protein